MKKKTSFWVVERFDGQGCWDQAKWRTSLGFKRLKSEEIWRNFEENGVSLFRVWEREVEEEELKLGNFLTFEAFSLFIGSQGDFFGIKIKINRVSFKLLALTHVPLL
jgi:hypothetical protein